MDTNVCRCGRPKELRDISCLRCWERLPVELRANYIDTVKNKFGAPSYHVMRRAVERALAVVAKEVSA